MALGAFGYVTERRERDRQADVSPEASLFFERGGAAPALRYCPEDTSGSSARRENDQ